MTAAPRRRAAGRRPSTWRWVLGLLTAATLAACAGESRQEGGRRRSESPPDTRRNVRPAPADTTSIVTPVRADSLIGSARGAGGEASLATACAICHEGAHGAQLGRNAEAARPCSACHGDSHQSILALYAGTLRVAALRPDTLYAALLSCVACHTDSTLAASQGTARQQAMEAMCIGCHGTRFRGMLATWQDGLAWRTRAVDTYVAAAASDPRLQGAGARTRLSAARAALVALRAGGAVHNVQGAHQLFLAAINSTASAYALARVAAPSRPALGPDPSRTACLSCHYGVEVATHTVRNETFNHASHVVRGEVACQECHSDASYFTAGPPGVTGAAGTSATAGESRTRDRRHGQTTLGASACSSCHHDATTQRPCATCHANDAKLSRQVRVVMALKLTPPEAPTRRTVAFEHAQHVQSACESCHATPGNARDVVSCSTCHTEHHRERAAGCVACHGATMLATHRMDSHFQCASCHARETVARLVGDRPFCLSCHVKQATHEPARECSPCHLHLSPSQVRQRILTSPPPRASSTK